MFRSLALQSLSLSTHSHAHTRSLTPSLPPLFLSLSFSLSLSTTHHADLSYTCLQAETPKEMEVFRSTKEPGKRRSHTYDPVVPTTTRLGKPSPVSEKVMLSVCARVRVHV
jgi:hypothetical protein